jgi:hypothetical protein
MRCLSFTCLIAIVALACRTLQSDSPERIALASRVQHDLKVWPHQGECGNPIVENRYWIVLEGAAEAITSGRSLRLRTDDGQTVTVIVANIGKDATPDAAEKLRGAIDGRRVSVWITPSVWMDQDQDPHPTQVEGEVDADDTDIAEQLLLSGAARFVEAAAYTLSDYRQCLHRIAEREAKARHRGIWAKT